MEVGKIMQSLLGILHRNKFPKSQENPPLPFAIRTNDDVREIIWFALIKSGQDPPVETIDELFKKFMKWKESELK